MTTKATVTSIITNLEAIMTGLSLSLEDLSGDQIPVTPLGGLEYTGETFEDNSQEQPLYNTATFIVKIKAKRTATPAGDRDLQVTWIHDLKDAFTVAALNVGDLSASKLVSRINHDGATPGVESKYITIDYDLGIKYRVE